MSAADFRKLAELFPNETVTHSYVQDIKLPAVNGSSPGTFALVTLDNGLDHTKPTTLGPNTLIELGTVLEGLKERAARGEIVGVGVTGKPYFLVAGADLSTVKSVSGREQGLWMAQLGHDVYSTLANLGVPSFAFINGLALGGGLEIALQSTYRTVSTACRGAGPARGLHRPDPGLGRRVHPAPPDRPGKRPQGHDREPAEQQPHPHRAAGVQAGRGGRHVRAGGLRRAVRRVGRAGHCRRRGARARQRRRPRRARRSPPAGPAPSLRAAPSWRPRPPTPPPHRPRSWR